MYTVVLMMAMTGSSEATTFGGRRCHGCNGCNGCHVVACNGCNGGCHGRRMHGCHRRHRCHGCNGCSGWNGCHGGCHSSVSHGCHGCHGANGGVVIVQPRQNGNFAEEQSETGPIPQNGQVRNGSAPATIIVNLPAEARLTVDGQATTSTSARRVFVSPPLATGSEYFYTINAEIMRDGQPVTVTRRVQVAAGRETRIDIDFDRDANGNLQQGQPAREAQEAQPAREPQNLERPKNNNNNQQNREPQPNR